jgi:hypothetical protein
VYYGNGDGTFQQRITLGANTGGTPFVTTAADLNNDGYTDLVYINSIYNEPDQIRMILSAANGSYTDSVIAGLPSPVLGFVVADFNNDHIPDIFAINGNSIGFGMGQAFLGAMSMWTNSTTSIGMYGCSQEEGRSKEHPAQNPSSR